MHKKVMAIKRNETKENIFVTNEYFEKLGVSRQVVEYQRTSKKIDSVGMLKGMNLYFKFDADLLILQYWMNNLRRFVSEWKKASNLKADARKRLDEINLMIDVRGKIEYSSEGHAQEIEELSSIANEGAYSKEYSELRKLFRHYRLAQIKPGNSRQKPSTRLIDINREIDSFIFRLCAYRESELSLQEYKKKEKAKIAKGNTYQDIYKYFLLKHGKILGPGETVEVGSDLMEIL